MIKMSVAQGLTELKLLDSRIRNKIANTKYCTLTKKGLDKVERGTMTREQFNEEAKSAYQSLTDLIAYRNNIKSAIVISNATTKVQLSGESYTVAELIERKTAIKYEELLLTELKRQLSNTANELDRGNREVERTGEEIALNMVGSDKKTGKMSEEANAFLTQYRETQGYELVNPLDLVTKIKLLEERIDGFKANVDWVLTQSNVTTMIEVATTGVKN